MTDKPLTVTVEWHDLGRDQQLIEDYETGGTQ